MNNKINFVGKNTHFDYKEYIDLLYRRKGNFKDFCYEARNHKSIAKYALKVNINNIDYLGEEMYENLEVLEIIFEKNIEMFGRIIEKIKNKEIFYSLVCINVDILKYKYPNKIKDENEILKILKYNTDAIKYADFSLLNDIEFIKKIIPIRPLFIKLHNKYLNNIELVKFAICCEETEVLKMGINKKYDKSVYTIIPPHLKEDKILKQIIYNIIYNT